MGDSGLEDLKTVIFTANSVNKIISGHVNGRCIIIRGHFLANIALTKIIFAEIEWSETEEDFITETLQKFINNNGDVEIKEFGDALEIVSTKFQNKLSSLTMRFNCQVMGTVSSPNYPN